MAQLSDKEKIKRVEMAPVEVREMVAKAFLRDDIDDESVQYTFNSDSFEEMNEAGAIMENANAAEIEGIGATGFVMRTTKPYDNKNFNVTSTGGWNTCIKGYPNDAHATALANCVGYASGRFNEIINNARGTEGCAYTTLNCNAENFIERAVAAGLKTGATPKRGAIICWQKGTLASGDGAGHVGVVERVDNDNQIYTSESGYSGTAFWNQLRTNTNGRWGQNANYTFRAFIYLPDDVQSAIDYVEPAPQPDPEPPKPIDPFAGISDEELARRVWLGEFGNGQDRVKALGIRYDGVMELVNKGIGKPQPEPPKPVLNIGDTVKIIGTGNGSSYGTSNTAYGIGWTRKILKIWDGRAYPYQVGNNTGTTGFYKAEALEKK